MEHNNLILDESFQEEAPKEYVLASRGKRFANYIIDRIIIYVIFFAVGYIASYSGNTKVLVWLNDINPILDFLLTAFVSVIYYCMMEALLKGKTIGKFITRTRMVGEDGTTPRFSTILLRSLSRFVPFEPFSFLGNDATGWHDTWTDTIVVED